MVQLQSVDLKKSAIEAVVIPICEDQEIHTIPAIQSLVELAKEVDEFKGRCDDDIILYKPRSIKADRIIFLGLGKQDALNPESLRTFAGKAVQLGIKKRLTQILIVAPDLKTFEMEIQTGMEALMEGALLANHIFDIYKADKKLKPLKKIGIYTTPKMVRKYKHLKTRMVNICEGTLLARDWVSTPPNQKTPIKFAQTILSAARKTKLKATLLDPKKLQQKKMGALLSVASGSSNPPVMVLLEHTPSKAKKTIVLVGKGVTFDSGGINLKVSGSIADMKMDMAGAAAVAATLLTVADLNVNARIVGVIPLVENMPSGNATRPGDVVKTYAGKTVEIGNTDAEGRLILIDAMAYALKKYNPDTVIDIATLTGACMVALGDKYAGLFSNSDALADNLLMSSLETHERCWRMPLPEDYKKLLKSDVADLKNNSSSSWGGAITAALFLSEFIDGCDWAHIDIAGPAFAKKKREYCDVGGTGFGVRLFCKLLEKIAV